MVRDMDMDRGQEADNCSIQADESDTKPNPGSLKGKPQFPRKCSCLCHRHCYPCHALCHVYNPIFVPRQPPSPPWSLVAMVSLCPEVLMSICLCVRCVVKCNTCGHLERIELSSSLVAVPFVFSHPSRSSGHLGKRSFVGILHGKFVLKYEKYSFCNILYEIKVF